MASGTGGSCGSNGGGSSGEIITPGSGNKYQKIRVLGAGSFGEAWLARSTASNKCYVIKELKMTPSVTSKERESTFNEVNIIRKLFHVNIIRYKEFFIKPAGKEKFTICIVMEYADAGDLSEYIRRHREAQKYISESQIRNWFVQITFALQYLHKNNILHRDLKSQNIFMTSSRVLKLGDFGVSKTLRHENDFATTGIGTPQYISPEICRMEKYDFKSDIWALGCVLYELCALYQAFPGNDLATLIPRITKSIYKPIPSHFSISMADLIKVMLRPEPHRRPSAEQLLSSGVLSQDVTNYIKYIKSLPDVHEDGHKSYSGSISSTEGNGSSQCGSGGFRDFVES